MLAGYAVGFGYLLSALWIPQGVERVVAFFAVWLGYTAPFLAFTSVISSGHEKLVAKR